MIRRPERSSRAIRLVATLFFAMAAILPWMVPEPAAADVEPSRVVEQPSESTALTYHFPKQYRPAIELFDEEAEPAVGRLSEYLGFEEFPTVDVWLLPQVDDYFELKEEPNRAPKWAIGLSLGDRKTVIVGRDTQMPGGESTDIEKTFVHELAHVAIDVARGGGHVPRWFHEGIALIMAEEWTPERSDTLAKAASTGALIPLAELNRNFPAHHSQASLAYSQSLHFVRYLEEHHGRDAIAAIVQGVREGSEFGMAVESATGRSLAEIEGAWRESVTENTSWFAVLREDSAIFFGAVVIFIIGFVLRRQRNRGQSSDDDEEPAEWDYDSARYPLPGESED